MTLATSLSSLLLFTLLELSAGSTLEPCAEKILIKGYTSSLHSANVNGLYQWWSYSLR